MSIGSTALKHYQQIQQLSLYTLNKHMIWGRADLPAVHDGHVAVHEDQVVTGSEESAHVGAIVPALVR
jgi:hypothetical protein